MTRTTIAAVTAAVIAAGAAAPARADGWRIGLSIGTAFRIGDCGWGSVSVGIPIGGYRHGPYWDYCDDWPYYRAPRVCSPAYYRPAFERPYYGGWSGAGSVYTRAADEAAPSRLAVAPPAPAPARRVETEPEAWKALAEGDPAAMEIFGRLVASSQTAGTPEIGYAICAAQVGQLDRAEWAAAQAMRASPDVWTRIPGEPAIKDAAASALVMVHDGVKHAQLAAALRRVAGGSLVPEAATTAAPASAESSMAAK